ncbi:MAG: hypothetical protein ABJJ69_19965 [Paracoccaceae bacterium]
MISENYLEHEFIILVPRLAEENLGYLLDCFFHEGDVRDKAGVDRFAAVGRSQGIFSMKYFGGSSLKASILPKAFLPYVTFRMESPVNGSFFSRHNWKQRYPDEKWRSREKTDLSNYQTAVETISSVSQMEEISAFAIGCDDAEQISAWSAYEEFFFPLRQSDNREFLDRELTSTNFPISLTEALTRVEKEKLRFGSTTCGLIRSKQLKQM